MAEYTRMDGLLCKPLTDEEVKALPSTLKSFMQSDRRTFLDEFCLCASTVFDELIPAIEKLGKTHDWYWCQLHSPVLYASWDLAGKMVF